MTKLEVLKKAVEKLENGDRYSWISWANCNCGIIAQCATGLDEEKLRSAQTNGFSGVWAHTIASGYGKPNVCSITGLPISLISEALKSSGFTKKDIIELETLSNEDIAKRAIIDKSGIWHYAKKDNLLKYLKAWIEILEETVVVSKPEYKIVYIDSKLKEKELIMN